MSGQPGVILQPIAAEQTQYGVQTAQPQPGQAQWMSKPEGLSGIPPGLEYLTQIDQLVVKQKKDMIEIFTGWEQANKFVIMNSLGQQVYFATEESGLCERQCCGPARGFIMHVTDNAGQEVMRATREFKCCAGVPCCICGGCDEHCAFEVTIEAPVGNVVGKVRQAFTWWKPHFEIVGDDGNIYATIRGPCCFGAICCPDSDFPIYPKDNETTEIGKVSKVWAGWGKELFTDAQTFTVQFPLDMDVKQKAVFVGAVFLIDFMYYERKSNN